MTFAVLHQVGHNAAWNTQSLTDDKCGEGLILSPVHQPRNTIEKLSKKIRQASFFDPQFYLPSSQKRNLKSYDFFPETLVGGFDTVTFEAAAKDSAKKCIEFQEENGFPSIVIPARFLDQMYSDYIERQERFSVLPFLEQLAGTRKKVCLTLPLTDHMIEDLTFRTKILNWITNYQEIDQIYLIYSHERETKQIQSASFLIAALSFCREVRDSGLQLVVGYQNGEALLFTLIDEISISFGTFENTRIFSLDKFLVTDEERRGPKSRIYLPGLLNSIQFDQAKEISRTANSVWQEVYISTSYAEEVLARPVEPYFNQPELYKHYLICMNDQFNELRVLDADDRAERLVEMIEGAAKAYGTLSKRGVVLEKHGIGAHISGWRNALKSFVGA